MLKVRRSNQKGTDRALLLVKATVSQRAGGLQVALQSRHVALQLLHPAVLRVQRALQPRSGCEGLG